MTPYDMFTLSARAPLAFLATLLLLAVSVAPIRADLVWTPQSGWTATNDSLAKALLPQKGRDALDTMNKARADEESGHHSEAMSLYEGVARKYPHSIYASEALYRAARIRLDRRQFFKSFDEFQRVVTEYPDCPHFNSIIGYQYRIANALVGGERPLYFGWIPGFKNRGRGIEYFEKILVSAPYSDYAPLALMKIAETYAKLHEPEKAIDALNRMINAYPKNLLTPDAYLRLAQSYSAEDNGPPYDQNSAKQAMTFYQDFLVLYPNSPSVKTAAVGIADMKKTIAESKIYLGDFYFRYRSNYKAARVFYNEAITAAPDTPTAAIARTRLAAVDAAEHKNVVPAKGAPAAPATPKHFWFF